MARSPRLPVPVYHNLVCHCSLAARVSKMVDGEFLFALASDGFYRTYPFYATLLCILIHVKGNC
jgi:hypothetical protein